ncbi:MAG: DNA primase [Planctomycetes bacterium]|jgi:DNA primase|nr:DNA primase [Planctomycetota bacterium]
MINQSEDVKAKLDIVDLIREYIPVRAAGVNFQALCPFHREKTPSFVISPDKQIWHCFGCGKGGDIFSFVMEMEKLSFGEALRLLAPKAGVTLEYQDQEKTSERNRLLDVMEAASRFYQGALEKSAGAQQYLLRRGLSPEIIKGWQLGYSPDSWDDLLLYLKNKKYSDQEIFASGLSIKKEGISRYYNRFRDRIMFPINDINGNVVAFTARLNPAKEKIDKMGKYINSPQTNLYDKSRILFGLDKAKNAIKEQDAIIIVEGQMDAISSHQHGFKNTVASSGTALSEEQLKLIKRYTNNIYLAFDSDQAGQLAADRGINEALKLEINVKVITIPNGKDPDDCLRTNPEEWREAINKALPFMEYYFEKIIVDLDLKKVENKREVARKMLTIISRLGNKIEADHWLKVVAERLDVQENVLRETLEKSLMKEREVVKRNYSEEKTVLTAKQSREEKMSELLLALALKFPEFLPYIIDNAETKLIVGEINREFYNNLIIYYNEVKAIAYDSLRDFFLSEQREDQAFLLGKLELLGERDFYQFDQGQAKSEIITTLLALQKYYLKTRSKELEKLIASAEKAGNNQELQELLKELKFINDQLHDFN